MIQDLGYTKPLFILPFDHRSTFKKEFEDVTLQKQIIYEAFKKTVPSVISKEEAAILVDEEYGNSILRDAKINGFTTLLTTEKSGEKEFIFEYGDDFAAHIKKYNPTFAKALVRSLDTASKTPLKQLSDWCHENGYKVLIETIVEKDSVLSMIKDFQDFGIEADVWKIPGMESADDYIKVVEQARRGRENVGVVVLGGGEDKVAVEKWLREGSKVPGIIGFAVGRTIFWEPLVSLRDGKIKRQEAVDQISKNYIYFYKLFRSFKQ